jgi:hypothetical protein
MAFHFHFLRIRGALYKLFTYDRVSYRFGISLFGLATLYSVSHLPIENEDQNQRRQLVCSHVQQVRDVVFEIERLQFLPTQSSTQRNGGSHDSHTAGYNEVA